MTREEATAKAYYESEFPGGKWEECHPQSQKVFIEDQTAALTAADVWDAAHNVHRIELSDAAVGRARKALMDSLGGPYMTNEQIARAVLAAAVREEQ